jgi:flagellum-specific ATP synthase
MPRVVSPEARATADEARQLLAAYQDAEDLIRVGAYEPGSNPETDRAIALHEGLRAFLQQGVEDPPVADPVRALRSLLDQPLREQQSAVPVRAQGAGTRGATPKKGP